MNPAACLTLLLLLCTGAYAQNTEAQPASAPVPQDNCRHQDPAVETGEACSHSEAADTASGNPDAEAAPGASVSAIIDREISRIWQGDGFARFEDTVILTPPAPDESTGSGKPAVILRRPPAVRAPVVSLPPKPAPTRRQILQGEIDRERAALRNTETRLQAARRRNDAAAVQRLENQLADRRQNLDALQAEMRR